MLRFCSDHVDTLTNLEQQIFLVLLIQIWQSKWNTQEAPETSKMYFLNEVCPDTCLIFFNLSQENMD